MISNAKRLVKTVRDFLLSLSRFTKSSIALVVDLIGFGLCVTAALWLVYLSPYVGPNLLVIYVTSIASVVLAWWQGMYRSVVRYMGLDLFVAGARTAIGSALVGAGLMQYLVFSATPFRWATAYAAFSFIYICGSRYVARMFLVEKRANRNRDRVLIYGAGSAGVQLATSIQASDEFLPVAMLDDDPKIQGNKVKGLEVYPPEDLEKLCRRFDVKRVFLAVPRANHSIRRKILEALSEFPIHVQTIPDFGDIVAGRASVDEISDVEVQDLLGRDPVPANPELLEACVSGKNVMVTGAGGSIGSELCRQLLTLNPKRLILLEVSEPALYQIDRQLRDLRSTSQSEIEVIPLFGSVTDEGRMLSVLRSFNIQTVYHAAAYKHVPLVELNVLEGVKNNVLGTHRTAMAAMDAGVESFVLISTDKAVNPSSIMGATKRLAELILQAAASTGSSTRFCMVRFGNVLGSSGSVVPLFQEQIRNGGPITVTHPAITRYFMTIPEAAELVIQAGSMARGGDVFVLDMGEPVRIRDLAYRMVNLMGLTMQDEANPDGDIPIKYIGLRSAEKLYEELLIGSNVSGTRHQRILRADEDFLQVDVLGRFMEDLNSAADDSDESKACDILSMAVKEYVASDDIADLTRFGKEPSDESSSDDTVVIFPGRRE